MATLWFIFGLIIIFSIARYNESNKLFWTLLFAFLTGFALTKMVYDNKNESLQQVNSTQTHQTQFDSIESIFGTQTSPATNVVTAHNSVGQGLTPVVSKVIVRRAVSERTRDQPKDVTPKPPQ